LVVAISANRHLADKIKLLSEKGKNTLI